MCASFSLAFSTSILIVVISAMQLSPPPRVFDLQAKKGDSATSHESEHAPEIIEDIYMDQVRKSRITRRSEKDEQKNSKTLDDGESVKKVKNSENEENEEEMDTYICRKMARLKRVPMCVRLFDRPHYKDQLKIKFNFLAYRSAKPECEKHELAFRTKSTSMHTDVQQEMLLCPGRHHPLRTSWQLDDYRDVFYVSSGAIPTPSSIQPVPGDSAPEKRPVPDSLVVYKREWDADKEQFFVYDIIENFQPKTLTFAIVTEYDVEEDLHSMNAISYNNNVAEVEVIYIREMFKPLNFLILPLGQGAHLSRQDKIADLSESELVTLCWVILDQPHYKKIGFDPQPPPKQMDENAIVAEQKILNFRYSVDYNEKSIKQTMHACKPRSRHISQHRKAKTNPERIQISSGARPNSYFVYTLHKGKDWGKYNIFEFVENLPIERGTSAQKPVEFQTDQNVTVDSPTERNTEDFETKFMQVVHKRNKKEDIVCNKLSRDQLRTLCIRLFSTDHYAKEVKIFFNYRLSIMGRLETCSEREVTIVSVQLQSTVEMYHRMSVCEGRHNIFRTDYKLDDYKDLFHVSQGPDSNSVMVFRQNKTADAEWYQVYDIIPIENLAKLEKSQVTLNHIQEEYNQTLGSSYNSNGLEIEVIYIREMFKLAVVDTLAGQPESKMIALCYELLDRDPYRALNFEISKAALYSWRTRIKTYRLTFAHSKEYNDEHPTQQMYPCYGRHKDSEVDWRKDEYLHRYKISSGSRPNSFFVYLLLSTENQQRIYMVYEFIENVKKLETLEPVEFDFEDVREDLERGDSVASGARSKTGDSMKTRTGKPKQNEMKDAKPVKTKNQSTGPKSAEPGKMLKSQKPVRIDQNKPPIAKSAPTKPDKLLKVVTKNSKPIKIEEEPSEILTQVIAETPIIQQNPDKPHVESKNVQSINIQPGKIAGVMESVKNKEHETRIKPDDSSNVAFENLKQTETEREDVPEVLKLITQPKPEEPIEMNIENSEPVEGEKTSEVLKRVSATGRKTWTIPDKPIKIAEEKPRAVKSKQGIRPSPESYSASERITELKSRPTKTEVEMPNSLKNEIKTIRQRLRPINSNNRVTRPADTKPIKTNIEKSEPVKTSQGVVLKKNSGPGSAAPKNFRAGGKVNFKDTSDSLQYQTVY